MSQRNENWQPPSSGKGKTVFPQSRPYGKI
jgi:hypothetical protein